MEIEARGREIRAKFCTKINGNISEAKRCELDTNRDAEDIRGERSSAAMEMEGRFDSLLG